jgi:fructose-1,6-bisphosphatase II / sedoheptulose-1,7-bisphosphatase
MAHSRLIDRNLALEAVRVTEAAARAASRWMGRGDDRAADLAALDAMHGALQGLSINGVVRIGEASGHGSDKLSVGDKAGNGEGPKMDIALMPVEGPTIIAKGETNGLSIIAMTDEGGFLNVPDIYMDKIAVGGGLPDDIVDLDAEPAANLKELAKARKVEVGELVVCILDRPRHVQLIAKVRESGARIMLIGDGDVSGVIATAWPESGVDAYMGIGGAPQGVLAAAALTCVGGHMQTRLVIRNDQDRKAAVSAGIEDLEQKYDLNDMATSKVTFAATGVTNGAMLRGVVRKHGADLTHSLVMRSKTRTVRFVEAYHNFDLSRNEG